MVEHPYRSATLLLLACAAGAAIGFGTGVEGLQALTRYTGRAGFALFAFVFVLSPWSRLWPGELVRGAIRRRRHLGLAFAYVHSVHLIVLLTYVRASGAELVPSRLAGGIAGYTAMAVMAATSNAAAVRKLGPRLWRRLHTICLYYLWFVFFLTYLPRLLGKSPNAGAGPVEIAVSFWLVVAIAALRIAAWWAPSAQRREAVAAP